MDQEAPEPLVTLDEADLYRLLGDAWYAQFRPIEGEGYLLEASQVIGKREYASLLPQLQEDLQGPCHHGVAACVTGTIQRSGFWQMPASIVTAIAIKQGLRRVD